MTEGSPRLARITIFPLKSFDGLEVEEARVNGGAGLAHDREYRLTDAEGGVLNAKRLGEKILNIRAAFDLAFGEVALTAGNEQIEARLPHEADALEAWLSAQWGVRAKLESDAERGFPDDEELSGPTLISRATLAEVGAWFGFDEAEARRRLRANLEIDGVPAFWEDCLFAGEGEPRRFLVGDVLFEGLNPCARCTVPSRDSRSGAMAEPRFAKIFAQRRQATLPDWAEAARFNHFYRAAVNTKLPASENGKTLHRGDELRLL
ncbi:MAG: MOSC N-terminal beta barrel domain-containing protein [Acidobacteria bacterium]|nr:MOSC N-terminal beta barrel domain-containing protein [Acidobacteriota bacterium]